MKPCAHAIIGGTFDRLHRGHKALLKTALAKADNVTIGLTVSESISQKTLAPAIQPYAVRRHELQKFLGQDRQRVSIVPLKDTLGPAVSEARFDSIFFSSGTEPNVARIQKLRRRRHLPPLKAFFVTPVKDASGRILSSSRIRSGVVSREGFVYKTAFEDTKRLPPAARRFLKKPLGEILSARQVFGRLRSHKPLFVIAVGDSTVKSLIDGGYRPHLSIFDLRIGRAAFATSPKALGIPRPTYSVRNPAGRITGRLSAAVGKCFTRLIKNPEKHLAIRVKGEEDLAALPAIVLAPAGSVVIYGQPRRGSVYVAVDDTLKEQALFLPGKCRPANKKPR